LGPKALGLKRRGKKKKGDEKVEAQEEGVGKVGEL